MDPAALPPISGHALLILLVQLAGLLLCARLLSELMRRIGQPAVIGELAAGILLGPTGLGYIAPDLFIAAFPQNVAQFHLLELVSWLGMVFLLLLTGFETDLRVMRSLGRAALLASICGMTVSAAAGVTLGLWLPERYLVDPADRGIFAAFLATAMAITAMPVIAKILIDLRLIRRNLGIVILSAGVLDDTTGWLALSVIAGIASAGVFSGTRLGMTLGGLALFVVMMRWVVYPAFSRALRYVNAHVQLVGADITLIVVLTFLAAATTEALGVHAVFGAFAAGLLVRQVPRVRASSLHAVEHFVLSVLSPIFFAFVGLKVNLWALTGWELPALVIGVAMAAKFVGCYTGGRLGAMSHWESVALGFGMNARGAMELIVALIGLSLGLLTQEMYSTIVLVAVVTSFLAPLLLRAVLPKLPLNEEERRRLEDDARQRLLGTGPLRVLVPTAGGANAMGAFAIATPLVRASNGTLTALFVDTSDSGRAWRRWLGLKSSSLAGRGLESHLERVAARFGDQRKLLAVKKVRGRDPSRLILEEAERDYDVLMIGAAPQHLLGHSTIAEVVAASRLPVVIVRRTEVALPEKFRHLVVPIDGSVFSRLAADFAFSYAETTGAEVTLLHVMNETRVTNSSLPISMGQIARPLDDQEEARVEARIREDFASLAASHESRWDVRVLGSGEPSATIIEETHSERYDLLVLGAENKLLAQPLFFGQGTAAIVERAGCTTAVVVPQLA